MDNAAKALLIAGGILIGVLIISLSMYMYTSFQTAYEVNMNIVKTTQVSSFNSFLTQFGSENTNIQLTGDVIWNILAYVDAARNDPNSVGMGMRSDGAINADNYKRVLFFTDNCSKVYTYSYTFGPNGVVNRVTVN